jgi:hypothetical protein
MAARVPKTLRHYEDGEAKGINFSLSVAIELARLMLATARDSAQRGTASTLLGNALLTLGARESGTARLEEAVVAYRAALEERTRDQYRSMGDDAEQPRPRALDAGRAGERDSGTRLEEAVVATAPHWRKGRAIGCRSTGR